MRKGRCLRWADEDELPDRVKKPTTPRDPRAFADRIHQQDPLTPNLTPSFPNSYNLSQQRQDSVNNSYAAPRHMSSMGVADTSNHGGGGGGGGSVSQPSYLATPLSNSVNKTSRSTEHGGKDHANDHSKDETSKRSAPGGDAAGVSHAGGIGGGAAMQKDRYVDPYTRAHHHRLNRPWGECVFTRVQACCVREGACA